MTLAGTAALGALLTTWYGNKKLVDFCEANHPEQTMPCEAFDEYALFFAAAACYGVLDCTFHTFTGAVCGQCFHFTHNTVDAFALKWTLFGAGATLGFALSSPLSIEDGKTANEWQLATELSITGAMALLGVPGVLLFLK